MHSDEFRLPPSLILLRRAFLKGVLAAAPGALDSQLFGAAGRPDYRGPNVIIVRFGGGVRRLETIDPKGTTYAPFLRNTLAKEGTLFPKMEIDSFQDINTSHGEDRGDEEFYNFSNHRAFGANFKSNTLSLRRFKTFLLRRQVAEKKFKERELAEKQKGPRANGVGGCRPVYGKFEIHQEGFRA